MSFWVGGVASLGLAALMAPQAATAHHSFAMFDHVNRITLAGTVTRFEWTNPACVHRAGRAGRQGRGQALQHRMRQRERADARGLEVHRREEGGQGEACSSTLSRMGTPAECSRRRRLPMGAHWATATLPVACSSAERCGGCSCEASSVLALLIRGCSRHRERMPQVRQEPAGHLGRLDNLPLARQGTPAGSEAGRTPANTFAVEREVSGQPTRPSALHSANRQARRAACECQHRVHPQRHAADDVSDLSDRDSADARAGDDHCGGDEPGAPHLHGPAADEDRGNPADVLRTLGRSLGRRHARASTRWE